jgi:hypothetical protein
LTNIINIEILPTSIFWRVLITHGHALCIFSEFQKKKMCRSTSQKLAKYSNMIFEYFWWKFQDYIYVIWSWPSAKKRRV